MCTAAGEPTATQSTLSPRPHSILQSEMSLDDHLVYLELGVPSKMSNQRWWWAELVRTKLVFINVLETRWRLKLKLTEGLKSRSLIFRQ